MTPLVWNLSHQREFRQALIFQVIGNQKFTSLRVILSWKLIIMISNFKSMTVVVENGLPIWRSMRVSPVLQIMKPILDSKWRYSTSLETKGPSSSMMTERVWPRYFLRLLSLRLRIHPEIVHWWIRNVLKSLNSHSLRVMKESISIIQTVGWFVMEIPWRSPLRRLRGFQRKMIWKVILRVPENPMWVSFLVTKSFRWMLTILQNSLVIREKQSGRQNWKSMAPYPILKTRKVTWVLKFPF